jgi:putative heme-binding domain-containing protein
VGEEKRKEYGAETKDAACRSPVTREIFDAFLAAHEKDDLKGSEEYLTRILWDPLQNPPIRTLALHALRCDHPSLGADRLQNLIAVGDAALGLEAIRCLWFSADEVAPAVFRSVAEDRKKEPMSRAAAILGLAHSTSTSPETRRLLVSLLKSEGPELQREILSSLGGAIDHQEVEDALLDLGRRTRDADVVEKLWLVLGLRPRCRSTEVFAKLSALVVPRPNDEEEWQKVLAEPGDYAAGERVFFHPRGPQCSTCHRMNGRGGEIGPDLSPTSFFSDRRKVVGSILNPSREVAPHYMGWEIVTREGKGWTGRFLEEEDSVTFLSVAGERVTLENPDIRERRAYKASMMPEDLHAILTRKEFRDVVTFLSEPK